MKSEMNSETLTLDPGERSSKDFSFETKQGQIRLDLRRSSQVSTLRSAPYQIYKDQVRLEPNQ